MSSLLLLILRILHSSGVPIVLCGNQILIGTTQCTQEPPPPPSPPPHTSATEDQISISNGF